MRHTILDLIPMFAAFNISWFVNGRFEEPSADQGKAFQEVCISHILTRISDASDKRPAFIALGALAAAAG